MSGLPIPFICIQCGTDQNPCHVKVVGPTLGFFVSVAAAVGPSPESSRLLPYSHLLLDSLLAWGSILWMLRYRLGQAVSVFFVVGSRWSAMLPMRKAIVLKVLVVVGC